MYLNSKQNMYIFDVPLNDLFILDPGHDANSIPDQTKTSRYVYKNGLVSK